MNSAISWAEVIIDTLSKLGVKYACVSGGSRSTPLTYAVAKNKNIQTFVNIDERSSAFFALGIAKKTKAPVVLISTSGTATANFFPAIQEAYISNIPLIILTADRPLELYQTGSNQTGDQIKLYGNYVKEFIQLEIHEANINVASFKITQALLSVLSRPKAPIHINIPFRKPLEPDKNQTQVTGNPPELILQNTIKPSEEQCNEIINLCKQHKKTLLMVGQESSLPEYKDELLRFAEKLQIPILFDIASGIRFTGSKHENEIHLFDNFILNYKVDLIIQVGREFTSVNTLKFLKQTEAYRVQINQNNFIYDTAQNINLYISTDAKQLFAEINSRIIENDIKTNSVWLNHWQQSEVNVAQKIEGSVKKHDTEFAYILRFIEAIPDNSILFVANSMAIRYVNQVVTFENKALNVYSNRGLSGIDGLIATSLGLAVENKIVYLIIGDLALLHDTNSLHLLRKYNFNIRILLINNKGGGIFNMLPISDIAEPEIFEEYFITPQNTNFSAIATAFELKHYIAQTITELKDILFSGLTDNVIIECMTNSKESIKLLKSLSEN